MSVTEGDPMPRVTLVDRVKSLLTKPSATWDRIDAEPATVGGL